MIRRSPWLPLVVGSLAFAPSAFAQLEFAAPTLSPSALGSAAASYIRVANLNRDPYPDLLVSSSAGTMTALNQGPPSFGYVTTLVAGVGGGRIYASDLDRDGDSDLMISVFQPPEIQFVLNDGTGAFPGPIYRHLLFADRSLYDLAAANFDNRDADLEIVAVKRLSTSGSPWYLELFDADFSVAPPALVSRVVWGPINGDGTKDGLAVADLDLDGDLDFWCSNRRVYENDGSGNFSTARTVGRINPEGLAIGDLDGDGLPDLVQATGVQCCGDPGIAIYVGSHPCAPQLDYREEQGGFANRYAYFAETADFDGDGRAEILVGLEPPLLSTLSEVWILPTAASGAPSVAAGTLVESGNAYGAVVDVDADGLPDYVSVRSGFVRVSRNQSIVAGAAAEPVQEPEWPLPGVPPRQIWVDQQNPGAVPDGTCGAPFSKLTDALAAARNTDVVYVRPGRYNCIGHDPVVLLVVPSGVSLIGVGGPARTSIEGLAVECESGSSISGFTLVNSGDMTSAAMITARGAEIRGNVLFGYGAVDGIAIQDALPSRVVSNIVHFCSTGIVVESATTAGTRYPTAEIYYNTVVENRAGIEYSEANELRIVGNIVVGNNTYGIHHHCKGLNLNALLVDYNYVAGNASGNFVTTIGLGQPPCASPFPLVPGPHDQTAVTYNPAWFVDAVGDDFHLAPSCPLRDAGDPVSPIWLRTDVDGDPRSVRSSLAGPISGLVPDIGADEVALSRLDLVSDANSVTFVTRDVASGRLETKLFGGAPGLFPLGSPLNSQLLLNPFGILFVTPAAGPNANGEVPLQLLLSPGMCGARVYVQALVLDLGTLEGYLTNAMAYTTR